VYFSVLVCAMLLFVSDVDCADNGFLFWMEGSNLTLNPLWRPVSMAFEPGLVALVQQEKRALPDAGRRSPVLGKLRAGNGWGILRIDLLAWSRLVIPSLKYLMG